MALIGLDIGTTGCKAIVFKNDGTILGTASREYFIDTPHPNWAEQDSKKVYSLAMESLKEAIAKSSGDAPTAMALSCQGEAITPVDAQGNALRPAMLGMDTRTTKENEWLSEQFGADTLFERTGMPMHTINTLPKLLWIKANEPDIWKKADQFLLYEDFIIRKLSGKAVTSHCLASRTQMYHTEKGAWDTEILEKCGIPVNKLAELPSQLGGIVGRLRPEILKKLGLTQDVHIVSGGHDQACAAMGSGVINAGTAMVSTGTAEVVEVALDSPALHSKLRDGGISVYRHVVPGLYLSMTLNHCGGLVLRWYRDMFCDKQIEEAKVSDRNAYQLVLDKAPKGPTNLFVLPHLAGSGTPTLDTASKGAILGLTFADDRSTVAKAILEGLTFELRQNLDLLKEADVQIEALHAVGGGAKDPDWVQMKADICQVPLRIPKVTEAACLGAALLAGVATGVYSDYQDAVNQTVEMTQEIKPNPETLKAYAKRFDLYKQIYPALKALNHQMD